jgi:hypothetical protein
MVEVGPLGTDLAWSLIQQRLAAVSRTLNNYQSRCCRRTVLSTCLASVRVL